MGGTWRVRAALLDLPQPGVKLLGVLQGWARGWFGRNGGTRSEAGLGLGGGSSRVSNIRGVRISPAAHARHPPRSGSSPLLPPPRRAPCKRWLLRATCCSPLGRTSRCACGSWTAPGGCLPSGGVWVGTFHACAAVSASAQGGHALLMGAAVLPCGPGPHPPSCVHRANVPFCRGPRPSLCAVTSGAAWRC